MGLPIFFACMCALCRMRYCKLWQYRLKQGVVKLYKLEQGKLSTFTQLFSASRVDLWSVSYVDASIFWIWHFYSELSLQQGLHRSNRLDRQTDWQTKWSLFPSCTWAWGNNYCTHAGTHTCKTTKTEPMQSEGKTRLSLGKYTVDRIVEWLWNILCNGLLTGLVDSTMSLHC